ncbi:MAG: phosphoglucomutase (alpha-D-glucose-1,6-bisphosphate-dependent) [Thermodesulfobacteriota bacterium]
MTASALAGKRPPESQLLDVASLLRAYYEDAPDPAVPEQRVSFGTSGHRGSAFTRSFNEAHVVAMTQAICLYRRSKGIDGPLFLARDSHALSEPAFSTTLEVLAGNGIEVRVDAVDGLTATPVLSHAILTHNTGRTRGLADGIVLTPSHNPPEDGGFKYNPPNGGPADTDVTGWVQDRANELLKEGLEDVARVPFEQATRAATTQRWDYTARYVADLEAVVDLEAIRSARLRLGVDPLGGASLPVWNALAERGGIGLEVVNQTIDPRFHFMTLDWDGKIRMDCSSPYAMASLIALKDRFDVAFGNDTDADRHGIVTRGAGLLNPNHYLAVAIDYLFAHRAGWSRDAGVGKTIVSSSMIDRVAARLGRRLVEVPVGFKWFVTGLLDGSLGFGGEESAGASFLRRDGTVWTTDKDGIVLCLLAAEITARTGRDPGERYLELTREFGAPAYERIDAPATREQKAVLGKLSADTLGARELAGEPIEQVLSEAPAGGAIGGIKVIAGSGWFAARPSGTEDVYKIYAESFRGAEHLRRIQSDAQAIVARAISAAAGAQQTRST